MDDVIPPGDWLTVAEANALVSDVTPRRLQALAKSGRVKSTKVLGRLLLDRAELLAWKETPRHGGRPRQKAAPKANKKRKRN